MSRFRIVRFTTLTKAGFAPILAHNPQIAKIHVLQEKLSEVIAELKKEEFDYIFDLHNNLRSIRVKMALGIASSSFPKENLQQIPANSILVTPPCR